MFICVIIKKKQKKRSHIINIGILIWALVWFANDLYSYISSYFYFHLSPWGSALSNSTTMATAKSVNYLNYFLHAIGIHVGLLILSYVHWPKLWKILQQMETQLDLNGNAYLRCRWLCFAYTTYTIIMVIVASASNFSTSNQIYNKNIFGFDAVADYDLGSIRSSVALN